MPHVPGPGDTHWSRMLWNLPASVIRLDASATVSGSVGTNSANARSGGVCANLGTRWHPEPTVTPFCHGVVMSKHVLDSACGSVPGPDDLFVVPDLDDLRVRCRRPDDAYLALERARRQIEALQATLITDVAEFEIYRDDSHRSVGRWVQAVVNCHKRTADRRVQHAGVLAVLPAVAAAYASGEIGVDQVQLLAELFANSRAKDLLAPSEATLLDVARECSAFDFRLACQRWLAFADPDGAHRDQEMSRQNRKLGTTQLGTGFMLRAEGDALTGEVIKDILLAHADAEYHDDVARRFAEHGQDASTFPLARTATQRAYDALVACLLKAAGTTETTEREPLVIIHTTWWDLQQAIRSFLGTEAAEPPPSVRSRLCETDSGAPVDLRDLAVAALIGQVQRRVLDPAGLTIDLGRRSRLFVGAARDAVLLAGRRCCWPGCDAHAGRIEVDHISPWIALSGKTDPSNGAPMCGHHNRAKHNGRFSVRRDRTGWHHYRPTAPRSPHAAREQLGGIQHADATVTTMSRLGIDSAALHCACMRGCLRPGS